MNEKLVEEYYSYAVQYVKPNQRKHPTLKEEFYDKAVDRLISCANHYRPEMNIKFITYLTDGLKRGILDVHRKQGTKGVSGKGICCYKGVKCIDHFTLIVDKVKSHIDTGPQMVDDLDCLERIRSQVSPRDYEIMIEINKGESQRVIAKRFNMHQSRVSLVYKKEIAKLRKILTPPDAVV